MSLADSISAAARFLSKARGLGPPPSPNRKEFPFVASLDFQGIPIDVEQRKGDTRQGVDADGTPWRVTMRAHYGEIRSHARGAAGVMGARGMDGDRLDVYVGPNERMDKPTQLASFFREFSKQARANPAGQASLLGDAPDTATLLGQSAGRSKAGQTDMFKANEPGALRDLFARTVWLRDMTQSAHWNVTGLNFSSLHDLFGEQYTELAGAVDEIAETLRATERRPFVATSGRGEDEIRYVAVSNANAIAEIATMTPQQMAAHLAAIHERLFEACNDGRGEPNLAIVDLLSRRATAHSKAAWMLRSVAGGDAQAQSMVVELAPEFGERLWGSIMSKAAEPARRLADGSEVMALPWWARMAFDPHGLVKAGARGPYIKKVPTGKFRTKKDGSPGAQIYRYFYAAHHGGGVHNTADFKEGAKLVGDGGHYMIHGAKDGVLTVSHSSKPSERKQMTHAQLSEKLHAHHKDKLRAHHEKLEAEHKDALSVGNHKGAAKIRAEAAKTGHRIEDPQDLHDAIDRSLAAVKGGAKVGSEDLMRSARKNAEELAALGDHSGHEKIDAHGASTLASTWRAEAEKQEASAVEHAKRSTGKGSLHDKLAKQARSKAKAARENERRASEGESGADDFDPWSGGGRGISKEEMEANERKRLNKIPKEPVQHLLGDASSNIHRIAWTPGKTPGKGTMRVQFKSNDIYDYEDVPHDTYEAVRRGEHKGSHGATFHALIRGKHESKKIATGEVKEEGGPKLKTVEARERDERIRSRAEADAAKTRRQDIEADLGESAASATAAHPLAIHPEDMDPEGRYTTWKKREGTDQWMIGRSRAGAGFAGGADLVGTKRGPYGDITVAAFPEGVDPNANGSGSGGKGGGRQPSEPSSEESEASADSRPSPAHSKIEERQSDEGTAKEHAVSAKIDELRRDSDHASYIRHTYGLTEAEAGRAMNNAYGQKALEHAAAGDHDKARAHARLAVKDFLARDKAHNMSPSSAERYMKRQEKAAGIKKAAEAMARRLRNPAA